MGIWDRESDLTSREDHFDAAGGCRPIQGPVKIEETPGVAESLRYWLTCFELGASGFSAKNRDEEIGARYQLGAEEWNDDETGVFTAVTALTFEPDIQHFG